MYLKQFYLKYYEINDYICEFHFRLENELYICKSEMGNCQMELENVKASNIQLTEENSALQMSSKNSMSESQSLMAEMQLIKDTGRGIIEICRSAL